MKLTKEIKIEIIKLLIEKFKTLPTMVEFTDYMRTSDVTDILTSRFNIIYLSDYDKISDIKWGFLCRYSDLLKLNLNLDMLISDLRLFNEYELVEAIGDEGGDVWDECIVREPTLSSYRYAMFRDKKTKEWGPPNDSEGHLEEMIGEPISEYMWYYLFSFRQSDETLTKVWTSKELINKHGVSGALSHLRKQLPSLHFPKALRTKEHKEAEELIREVKDLCQHESTRTECVDYHRRDFGTICNDCGKILNTNG